MPADNDKILNAIEQLKASQEKGFEAFQQLKASQEKGFEAFQSLLDEVRTRYTVLNSRLDGMDIQMRGDGQAIKGIITRVAELESSRKMDEGRIEKLEENHNGLVWKVVTGMGAVIVILFGALGTLTAMLLGSGSNHK